ncbi:MAG: L,D-transpeptidase [Alphaproteobacteria bacterium]|nr:L,D-transpeptidase [Alphaproteobacteria bacterium]
MRMRIWFAAGVALATLQLALPASAEKVKFSPKAFQVFGGIDDSAPQAAAWRKSDIPDSLRSRKVSFASQLAPGSILVKTGTRRLYYILPLGQAIEYKVGVGREGFTWSGENIVSRKSEWPDWRPPLEMIRREAKRGHKLPDFMPGGPKNPLGARAIYIGDTQFRIHGTTQPWSIGQAVSSGCIRMMNEEVIDLYERVKVGATVVVED